MPARDDTPQPAATSMTSPATRTSSFAARLGTPRRIATTLSHALRQPATAIGARLFRRFAGIGGPARRAASFNVARSASAHTPLEWLSTLQRAGSMSDHAPSHAAPTPRRANSAVPMRSARAAVQRGMSVPRERAMPPSPANAAALPLLQRAPFVPPQQTTAPLSNRVSDLVAPATRSAPPQMHATALPLLQRAPQHTIAPVLHRASAPAPPLLSRVPAPAAPAARSAPSPQVNAALPLLQRAPLVPPQQTTTAMLSRVFNLTAPVARSAPLANTALPLLQRASLVPPQHPAPAVLHRTAMTTPWLRRTAAPAGQVAQHARASADTLPSMRHDPPLIGATSRAETSLPLLRAVRVAPAAAAPPAASSVQSPARDRQTPLVAAPIMRQSSRLPAPQRTPALLVAATAHAAVQRAARSLLTPGTAHASRPAQMLQRLQRAVTSPLAASTLPAATAPMAWQAVLLPFVQRTAAPATDVQRGDVRGVQGGPVVAAATPIQRRAASLRQPLPATPQPQSSHASSELVMRQSITAKPAALMRRGFDPSPGMRFAATLAQRHAANTSMQRESLVRPRSNGHVAAPMCSASADRPVQRAGALDAPFVQRTAAPAADVQRAIIAQRASEPVARATTLMRLADRTVLGPVAAEFASRQVQRASTLLRDMAVSPRARPAARSDQRRSAGTSGTPPSLDLVQPSRRPAAIAGVRPMISAQPDLLRRASTAARNDGSAAGANLSRVARSSAAQVAQRAPLGGRLQPRQVSGAATPVQRMLLRQSIGRVSGGLIADRGSTVGARRPGLALLQPQRGSAPAASPTAFAPSSSAAPLPAPHSAPRISRAASDAASNARTTDPSQGNSVAPVSSIPARSVQPMRASRAASLIQPWRAAPAAAAPFVQRQALAVQRHAPPNQWRARPSRLPLSRADAALTLVQPWRSMASPGSLTQRAAHLTAVQTSAQRNSGTPVQRPAAAPIQSLSSVLHRQFAAQHGIAAAQHSALYRSPAALPMLAQRRAAAPASAHATAPRRGAEQPLAARRATVQRTASEPNVGRPLLFRAFSGSRSGAEHFAASPGIPLIGQQPTFVGQLPALRRVTRSMAAASTPVDASGPAAPVQRSRATAPVAAQPTFAQHVPSLARVARTPAAQSRVFSPAALPLMQRQSHSGAAQSGQPHTQSRVFSPAALPLMQRQLSSNAGTFSQFSTSQSGQTETQRRSSSPASQPSMQRKSLTGTSQPAQPSVLQRTAFQPAMRADMRVFTQVAAASQPDSRGSTAAMQRSRSDVALPHVQPTAQAGRASSGAVQRMDAVPTPLSFVQHSAQASAPGEHAATQAGPVGTVLQRAPRTAAHTDGPLSLLRPATPRAPEQAAPIQRQETSTFEAQAEQNTAENEIDIEALAQQVYARLRRRLAVEAERVGRR